MLKENPRKSVKTTSNNSYIITSVDSKRRIQTLKCEPTESHDKYNNTLRINFSQTGYRTQPLAFDYHSFPKQVCVVHFP